MHSPLFARKMMHFGEIFVFYGRKCKKICAFVNY